MLSVDPGLVLAFVAVLSDKLSNPAICWCMKREQKTRHAWHCETEITLPMLHSFTQLVHSMQTALQVLMSVC